MKTYRTHILHDNLDSVMHITEEEAKRHKNIVAFIRRTSPFNNIKRIYIDMPCANGIKGTFKEVVYCDKLEDFLTRHVRVEITWKPGYEDYSGYGNRCDGKKQRCRIGRSTGWIPIYLQILTSKSTGGCGLSINLIESIKEI